MLGRSAPSDEKMRTEKRAEMQALFLNGQLDLWRKSCGGILIKLHDTVFLELLVEGPSGDAQTSGRFTLMLPPAISRLFNMHGPSTSPGVRNGT
jgi:hypothetical protein